MKTLLLAASAALLLSLAGGGAAAGQGEAMAAGPIRFELMPAAEGRVTLQLGMSGPDGRSSSHGRTMALSDLEGLSAGPRGPVRFRLVREAGIVACEGPVEALRGSGTCRFTPDAGFAAALDRRGIGRPSVDEQFHLAMAGAGVALLDELARQDYPMPNLHQFVALAIHGVDVIYVRAIDGAGYRREDVDDLIGFRIHGITPAWIREMAEAGYRELTAEQLLAMRIHRVSAEYVREMAAAGLRGLSVDQLVALRIHSVRPEHARAAVAEVGLRESSTTP